MKYENLIKDTNSILFQYIAGSHLYKLNTPESDVDTRGIYIESIDNILVGNIDDICADEKNDNSFNELSKFVALLHKSDPICLESLYVPEQNILIKSNVYDLFRSYRNKFLSKKSIYSFCGYATEQIKRARGLNKKVAQEKRFADAGEKIEKPNVLNFCYVADSKGGSIKVVEFLKNHGWNYKMCGLVNTNNMKDTYTVFIEGEGHQEEFIKNPVVYNYSGICRDPENSYEVCLSSIPKGIKSQFIMYFNKDAYSNYCRFYREYNEWKAKRNPVRYNVNLKHEYDVKNAMHLMRLLETGYQLLLKNEIIVVHNDEYRKFLMDIRNGKYEFEDILNIAETKYNDIKKLLETSYLPDEPDHELIDKLFKTSRLYQLNDNIKIFKMNNGN